MSKIDRAALKAALDAALSAIGALRVKAGETQQANRGVMLGLAVELWLGGEAYSALHPAASVVDWAVEHAQGFGQDGGGISPQTAYRLRNAGRVATVLGTKLDGRDVNYTSLVPLHRYIAAAAGKSEKDQATAARKVGTLWSQAVKAAGRRGRPTEEAVKVLCEADMPSGTRGSKGATAEGRKAAKTTSRASSATKAAAKNEPTKGNEPTTSVVVESAALEAAIGVVQSQLRSWQDTRPTRPAVMLATLRLAEEHGGMVIEAAIHSLLKSAVQRATENEKTQAAPVVAAPVSKPKTAAPVAASKPKTPRKPKTAAAV